MARSWKLTAWTVAWLGLALPLRAQTPPPPVPVAPSGVAAIGPMGPMGPLGPNAAAPVTGQLGIPGNPNCPPGGDDDPLNLENRVVRDNAFNGPDGGDCRPLEHQLTFEYLILWFKQHTHPPLVTTGFATDAIPGALDQPNTKILNNTRTGAGASDALRVTYTYWLVDPEICAVDSSFMIMERRLLGFRFASDANGTPVISRPFFNPVANTEDADPRALPNTQSGSVTDHFLTRLMGAEANFKYNVSGVPASEGPSFTVMVGPRWIRLDEKYFNLDFSQDLPAGTGQSRVFNDNITCYNNFFGGQIGSAMRCRWDRLSLELLSKIAVGQNFQSVKTVGITGIHDDATGANSFLPGALYVQNSNTGNFHFEHISVVPEVNLNVGIQITDNFKFSFGYGVFDMSNVVRPGSLIQSKIEIQTTGIPGTFPTSHHNTTDFWAQWVNFGFEFVF